MDVNAQGAPVQRGQRPYAPVSAPEAVEPAEAAPEASEGQVGDRRITRAGWREVLEGDPEPGTGFFRFAAKDLPGMPERSRMAPTVECFGTDLANAHAHLRMIVAQARRVKTDQVDVSGVWPIAHRATRLCKRARQARGET